MTRGRGALLALAGLAAVVAATLFEALFLDRVVLGVDPRVFAPFSYFASAEGEAAPTSMNFMSLDLTAWLVPERLAQLRAFAAGRLPLWNPGEAMGQPLLATLGDAPFYPVRLLDLVLPATRAIALSLALHLVLLGAGTWLVMRRAGLHPAAAWLGAVTMALSGYVTAHFQTPLIVRAIAWLPWMHLALARLAERPSLARAGAVGLVVGASFLVGFPQASFLSLYAAALCVAPRAVVGGRAPRVAILAIVGVVLGVAISAVHIVPASELLGESLRAGGWSAEAMRDKSLAPQSLVGYVLPHFFGSPVAEIAVTHPVIPSPWDFLSYAAWQTQEVQNNFEENALFTGLIPLTLALAGSLRRGRARLALAGLVAVLLVAVSAPLIGELTVLLPGMRYGSPKRVLFLAAYAVAWLAALELDRLTRLPLQGRARGLLVGGAALVLLGLAALGPFERWLFPDASSADQVRFREVVARDLWLALAAGFGLLTAGVALRLGKVRIALALLLAGTAVELVGFARHTNPDQPAENLYGETPTITWLREQCAADPARVLSFGDHTVLIGSVAQHFGLRSCNAMVSLLPRRPGELMRAIEPNCLKLDNPCFLGPLVRPESLASPILDLVGARYVVTGAGGYRRLGDGMPEIGVTLVQGSEAESIAVYERTGALPPAFLVQEVAVVEGADARLATLAEAAFEPGRVALVEAPLPQMLDLSRGEVAYRRPAPEEIVLRLEPERAARPAFVVVTETHMPGWRAEVDGARTEVVRVDHAFLGVPVPPGAREVRLVYAPRSFTVGWALSLVGLVACLGLVMNHRRQGAQSS